MASRAAPEPPPVIALAGPTASGKTAAALALAEAIDGEVVSVDSALVYRGMDIGTAKPTPEERRRVPHHLIDIREPDQPYSAADFVADARGLIDAIRSRGRSVLLVGGTMLYFKALIEGLDAMPPAHPQLRAAIEAEALARGWPALHAELAQVDAATATRLAPNDAQRIQRALEVYRATGRPLSAFHGAAPRDGGFTPDAFFSLEPVDRAWLHERIARRFDAMLAAGLLEETRALLARGLSPALPSLRSVGYRQAIEALEGRLPMVQLRDRGIFASRQLAKRQVTWLRSMRERRVIACDAPDALQRLLAGARAVRP